MAAKTYFAACFLYTGGSGRAFAPPRGWSLWSRLILVPTKDYCFPTTLRHLAEVLQVPTHSSFLVPHTVNADPSRADPDTGSTSIIYIFRPVFFLFAFLMLVNFHDYRHVNEGQEGKV